MESHKKKPIDYYTLNLPRQRNVSDKECLAPIIWG